MEIYFKELAKITIFFSLQKQGIFNTKQSVRSDPMHDSVFKFTSYTLDYPSLWD